MIGLVVETDDFVAASRTLCDDVADPLTDSIVAAIANIGLCGGMAGNEPGGAAWAMAYDHAAIAALNAADSDGLDRTVLEPAHP